ncbi:uncharacterized protein LOC144101135 [Amblyomma americanum]
MSKRLHSTQPEQPQRPLSTSPKRRADSFVGHGPGTSNSSQKEQGPSTRKKPKRNDQVADTEGPCKVFIYMTPLESGAASSPSVGREDNPLPLGMQNWTVVFLWEKHGFRVEGFTRMEKCVIFEWEGTKEEASRQHGEKVECGEHKLSFDKVRDVVKKMKQRGEFKSTPDVATTLLAKLGIELPVQGILFVAFKGLFDVFNFLVAKRDGERKTDGKERRRTVSAPKVGST